MWCKALQAPYASDTKGSLLDPLLFSFEEPSAKLWKVRKWQPYANPALRGHKMEQLWGQTDGSSVQEEILFENHVGGLWLCHEVQWWSRKWFSSRFFVPELGILTAVYWIWITTSWERNWYRPPSGRRFSFRCFVTRWNIRVIAFATFEQEAGDIWEMKAFQNRLLRRNGPCTYWPVVCRILWVIYYEIKKFWSGMKKFCLVILNHAATLNMEFLVIL